SSGYATTLFAVIFSQSTATAEVYTLSLHDALPISGELGGAAPRRRAPGRGAEPWQGALPVVGDARPAARVRRAVDRHQRAVARPDRKSTRLNSSHSQISYAVFCLKKKKNSSATQKT